MSDLEFLIRYTLKLAEKYPGEPEKVVNDVLHSDAGEQLAASQAREKAARRDEMKKIAERVCWRCREGQERQHLDGYGWSHGIVSATHPSIVPCHASQVWTPRDGACRRGEDCPAACDDGHSFAAPPDAGQGTAWRREAPTVDGWYPFRAKDGERLMVVGIRDGGADVPGCPYSLVAADLVGEWGPRVDLNGSSPIPAAQVVEAARKDGER